MGIIVYGRENCPMCEKLKTLLTYKNINFEYKEDMNVAIKLGKENNITTLPITSIDNKAYNFNDVKNKIEMGEL